MLNQPQLFRALVYSGDIKGGAKDVNANVDTIRNCFHAEEALAALSIDDMVTKLEATQHLYKCIAICGHAAAGNQSIGGTYEAGKEEEKVIRSADDYQPAYDLLAGQLAPVTVTAILLQRLQAVMVPGGILFLAGCEVAKGNQGATLLKEVSAILLNVWVVGITLEVTERHDKKEQCIKIEKANESGKALGPITLVDLVMARNGHTTKKFPPNLSVEEMLQEMTHWPTNKK